MHFDERFVLVATGLANVRGEGKVMLTLKLIVPRSVRGDGQSFKKMKSATLRMVVVKLDVGMIGCERSRNEMIDCSSRPQPVIFEVDEFGIKMKSATLRMVVVKLDVGMIGCERSRNEMIDCSSRP
ncbi:hypothetical protein F2Q68_00044516 [Brassica cretica]|uniref:Uncharacterized protein n=1 Tax=Brassica cretica TaxID=69181 RepID=A0A8S9LMW6_BRACR|nr:hypothetical protein F2Q68_00044516 [Brassica cretica]